MRSHLIYDALKTVPNRYVLCQVASKATRKFHRPSSRVQDTMNEVFERFSQSEEANQIVGEPEAIAEAQRRAA
ncbi:MAG: DNA-directed RNA polymerase subunit omega [Pyrinomonadaceae bacterium]